MEKFVPFGNASQSLTLEQLTLENQGDQLNLYGNMTLTLDKQSLANAKNLQDILTQAIAYMEKNNAASVDRSAILAAQQASINEVKNPFG